MYNEALFAQIATIILFVGGIDMGLHGLLGSDLIVSILGAFLGRLALIIVGVAAGFLIYLKYFKKPVV